jgi:hypothetical protein
MPRYTFRRSGLGWTAIEDPDFSSPLVTVEHQEPPKPLKRNRCQRDRRFGALYETELEILTAILKRSQAEIESRIAEEDEVPRVINLLKSELRDVTDMAEEVEREMQGRASYAYRPRKITP